MNRTPHLPNSGLRTIVRAQHERAVASNRAQGPAIMRAIADASRRSVASSPYALLSGSIGCTSIPEGK